MICAYVSDEILKVSILNVQKTFHDQSHDSDQILEKSIITFRDIRQKARTRLH